MNQKILEFVGKIHLWIKENVNNSPARMSLATFSIMILIGTILLKLPVSSTTGSLSFIDSLFTATSAVCVTGLIVVDTATQLSRFGQTVVLVLIQVGGLGILTISSAFLISFGRKIGLIDQIALGNEYTAGGSTNIYSLIKNIVIFTLIFEAAGALLLYFRFNDLFPTGQAVYYSVFHAISGFCNAGFSLFSDSLVSFSGDFYVNAILMVMIVAGGIGFLVLTEIKRKLSFSRKFWTQLSLHTKIVLCSSGILLVLGSVFFFLLEYTNTLSTLPWLGKITASMFQSVTARTAGFNSVPIGNLANGTMFMLIMLMFIGGASGSTAGGVKVGTIAALAILGFSRLKGFEEPQIFNRRIYKGSIARATGVVLLGSLIVGLALLALNVVELGSASTMSARGKFLDLLFETISAFGTVGLSTGITPTLGFLGKLIIATVMLAGRLGPLTLAMAFTSRVSHEFKDPEEPIMIG